MFCSNKPGSYSYHYIYMCVCIHLRKEFHCETLAVWTINNLMMIGMPPRINTFMAAQIWRLVKWVTNQTWFTIVIFASDFSIAWIMKVCINHIFYFYYLGVMIFFCWATSGFVTLITIHIYNIYVYTYIYIYIYVNRAKQMYYV